MEHGFEVVTTPFQDGKIVQETYSVGNGVRERIMREVIDTKDAQVQEALIALGWNPPNVTQPPPPATHRRYFLKG